MTGIGEGRLWIRLMKGQRCQKDVVVPCHRGKPQAALREALPPMDVSQPMWLPRHEADWAEYAFTRFLPEHFVDGVGFDRMEISFIFPDEEKKPARRRSPLEDA